MPGIVLPLTHVLSGWNTTNSDGVTPDLHHPQEDQDQALCLHPVEGKIDLEMGHRIFVSYGK